jgi:NhaP-type Na+/H+ or K+/H+ antiporter
LVNLIPEPSYRNDPYAIAAVAVAVFAYLFVRISPLLGLCMYSCLPVLVISACGGLVAVVCGLFARQPERMATRSGRDLALIGIVLGAYLIAAPLLSRGIGLLYSLAR